MKNLKFKHISAYNFLCFGPEGIEINFEDHSNVIFIQGLNKDAKSNNEDASLSEENKISSNGSGKSSIQEIIVYGLFGKTVKKHTALKKDGVIHNLVGKNCKVVIIWDDFKIVRTRSKNTLREITFPISCRWQTFIIWRYKLLDVTSCIDWKI